MKLGPLVLRLRLAETVFENRIGGAAELDYAMNNVVAQDEAYVIPLAEDGEINDLDSGISQSVVERFGVVAVLKNAPYDGDKTGLTAYDKIHDVRDELFRALLGLDLSTAQSSIYYRGGKLLGINAAQMWWQFEFEYRARLASNPDGQEEEFGVAGLQVETDATGAEIDVVKEPKEISLLDYFNTVYTQYVLTPSTKWEEDVMEALRGEGKDLPIGATIPDMVTRVDLTDDPDDGGFNYGFATGFDFYKK